MNHSNDFLLIFFYVLTQPFSLLAVPVYFYALDILVVEQVGYNQHPRTYNIIFDYNFNEPQGVSAYHFLSPSMIQNTLNKFNTYPLYYKHS